MQSGKTLCIFFALSHSFLTGRTVRAKTQKADRTSIDHKAVITSGIHIRLFELRHLIELNIAHSSAFSAYDLVFPCDCAVIPGISVFNIDLEHLALHDELFEYTYDRSPAYRRIFLVSPFIDHFRCRMIFKLTHTLHHYDLLHCRPFCLGSIDPHRRSSLHYSGNCMILYLHGGFAGKRFIPLLLFYYLVL